MCPLISTAGCSPSTTLAVVPATMQKNQSLIKGLKKGVAPGQRPFARSRGDQGEAHRFPTSPSAAGGGPWRLVGAPAGYVTKRAAGEGIYFAARVGGCARADRCGQRNGNINPYEKISRFIQRSGDRQYGATYKVLEIPPTHFLSHDAAREAFVEMCDDRMFPPSSTATSTSGGDRIPWQQIS